MSLIYLSEHSNPILQKYLYSKGHEISFVKDTNFVYNEVSAHPDIYMCKLGAEPSDPVFHISNLSELGFKYPYNIKYNGVCLGNYFIHNTHYTSTRLLEKVNELTLTTINVKQGYTKCSMAIINSNSAITADEGIYSSVQNLFNTNQQLEPLNILLISKGNVLLEGFPYGFIGGACGRVGDEIIFNGNLEAHPDFIKISDFIQAQGLNLKYFKEYPLEDIGSIIEESN